MAIQSFKPNRSSKKKFHWVLFSSLLFVGLVLIGSFYFVFYSDFFDVREVVINGNKLIEDQDITSALIGTLASDSGFWERVFGAGNILFWQQPSFEKLISRLPLLADLKLSVEWQSKKIIINVQERAPAGVWCFGDYRPCYLFDDNGYLFSFAPEISGSLILKVIDETGVSPILGKRIFFDDSKINEFFAVLAVFKNNDFSIDYVLIKSAESRELAFKLSNGPLLRLKQED
ncbi:MAG: hypothetical protein Q8P06_01295, partial [Candidatus Azambacteria bacterium]|nr:hypothetical protein [Candidatus Azambacteria bacterium]